MKLIQLNDDIINFDLVIIIKAYIGPENYSHTITFIDGSVRNVYIDNQTIEELLNWK